MPFAPTWMDLEIIILSEISHTVKDKHHMISLLYGILKKDRNELICRTETDSQTLKKMYDYQRGHVVGWEGWTGGLGLAYAH